MAQGLGHLRFNCTRCGNCCRRFRVPLTGADLQRLVAGTGAQAGELVQWLEPGDVDMTGEPETFVLLPEGRRLLVLGWAGGGCAQLEGDLCGVHPHRPASCRAYPFHAVLGKRDGIRRLELLDTSDCRHTWGSPTPQREVARGAKLQRAELTVYAERVQTWNRMQRHRARLGKPLRSREAFLAEVLRSEPPDTAEERRWP